MRYGEIFRKTYGFTQEAHINLESFLLSMGQGFADCWKVASVIPGHLSEAEAFVLYSLAHELSSRGPIVEVGCFAGRSTYVLARGAFSSPQPKVFAIDNFSKTRSRTFPEVVDPEAEFTEMLRSQNLETVVTLLKGNSSSRLLDFKERTVPLIFIDGDHSKEQVAIDFDLALRVALPGGFVVFHDYQNPFVSSDYSMWLQRNVAEKFPCVVMSETTREGNGLLLLRRPL